MMAKRFDGAESTPVSPGELKVKVDVSAVYELVRR